MSDEETKAPGTPDSGPESDGADSDAPEAGKAAAPASDSESPAEAAASEEASAPEEPEVDEAAEKAKAEAAAKAKAEAAAKAKAAKEAAEAAKPPWERDPAVPEWADADDPIANGLREAHGEALLAAQTMAGDLVLTVERSRVRQVAQSLHDDHGYTMLLDICGADYGEREEAPRFEVIYHLLNLETAKRVRIKTSTGEDDEVPSVVPIWRGANWPERETYDMYGIRFADHPDMTRILMWEGFNGYPLRKDFPVEGIDTGTAIYPEYYDESAGPVTGTGTGWRPPEEPEEEAAESEEGA